MIRITLELDPKEHPKLKLEDVRGYFTTMINASHEIEGQDGAIHEVNYTSVTVTED